MRSQPKIVILGMLTKIPVGGVIWLVGQYAVGFARLGFDVYYVEAHGRTPSMFMESEEDDGVGKACAFLDSELRRFGLGGKWAYHAVHDDGACYGLSRSQLNRLYRDAALIINLHGGTVPLDEHSATGRLVYMGTDPGDVEIEVAQGRKETIDYLEPHVAFFTWGLNYGNPDCLLPWNQRFPFVPSPPPVVMDFWEKGGPGGSRFTTIGNWRQDYRDIVFRGERYTWSKHHEFLKIVDLPRKVHQPFELALSSYTPADRDLLESHGWSVRSALEVSADPAHYRQYIQNSRGEFSVAKDQNVRLRTGWFSERSAMYLAAGRPVILQDTGFGNALPMGRGLLAFNDLSTAIEAVVQAGSNYEDHQRTARAIAAEYLSHDVVLVDLLDRLGLAVPTRQDGGQTSARRSDLPSELVLEPLGRRPLRLPTETINAVLGRPIPSSNRAGPPELSIIVPVHGSLTLTRMALESVLQSTTEAFELIAVNNAAEDDTARYLSVLAARNARVRVLGNGENLGFAAACNEGIRMAQAPSLVILNNDTIVTPGWSSALLTTLIDGSVGLVSPSTNRCGNSAEVPSEYSTYGELLAFAESRLQLDGVRELDVAVMFCVALRRDVAIEVGEFDEQFTIGTFEDDDYSLRVRRRGYRIVCSARSFVHHFGEGAMGELAPSGAYAQLLARNRALFEKKWGVVWRREGRTADAAYQRVVATSREAAKEKVPSGSAVLVVSKGDEQLLNLPGVVAKHFPSTDDGIYRGHHPRNRAEAVDWLEGDRRKGFTHLLLPAPSFWWLDHYRLSSYLNAHYRLLVSNDAVVIYELDRPVRRDR